MSLVKNRGKYNRIKAERYIYSHRASFPSSVTEAVIERAIMKVQKALDDLTLKPVETKGRNRDER